MSSETEDGDAVLRYRGKWPGVVFSSSPSQDELAFDWTLSEADKSLALENRGNSNVLRLAAQLCVFRKHGRFLSDYSKLPSAVVSYLCQQLELEVLTSVEGSTRRNTESDHQKRITHHFSWKPFDEEANNALALWISEQISEHLYVEDLIEKSEAFLRGARIVIPGPTVLEREINTATRRAEAAVWKCIAEQIPENIKGKIDKLLDSPQPGKAEFFRFAEYPPEARAMHIVRFLERYQLLATLGLDSLRFHDVGSKLLRKVASVVKTYSVWQIKRFEPNKRHALAACFLFDSKQTMLDYLAEMHIQFMTAMERKSRHAWEKEHRLLRKRLKHGVAGLRKFASHFLSDFSHVPGVPNQDCI